MQKITPFLWFDGRLEEAMNYYLSVFKNGKIKNANHLPGEAPGTKGDILTATFELEGIEFMGINAGPMYKFTPAISFFVKCKNQEEVDELWTNLSDGSKEEQCGWITDKFGVSWQIIPDLLGKLMGDPDRVKANRVMQAMLKMKKIDCALLQAAYDQK